MIDSSGLSLSPRTAVFVAIVFFFQQIFEAVALRTTRGSPCADVCHRISTNTTSSEIVCLDVQYNTTSIGTNFQKCVECELRSDYRDATTGESDVSWGLYNLRYAFTTCIYGYPEKVANISSPCIVSCQPLSTALEYDLLSPSTVNFETLCSTSSFADNAVSKCEFCYNLTGNQVYMANFLEAVRYDCHFRTATGTAFAINPDRIFKQSGLPSSTAPLGTKASSSGSGIKNLTLVIALPILAFVVLVCSTTVCCFFFIRWRRKKAKRSRQSAHLHARWNDTTMSTPARTSWGPYSPYLDQQQQQQAYMSAQKTPSPGYGPGFGFQDMDGQRHDVGFSKAHNMVDVTDEISPITAPSATHSPDNEKDRQSLASYFPMASLPQKQ